MDKGERVRGRGKERNGEAVKEKEKSWFIHHLGGDVKVERIKGELTLHRK